MFVLPGYEIAETLYESSKTVVCRGWRSHDDKPVAIKLLKGTYPTPRELALFRKQYSLMHEINSVGVVRPYSLEPCGNGLALVMEDFGALSLKEYGKTATLRLDEFFAIAIQISKTLAELHHHRIIHKDIKPANVLFNPTTGQVKITDFSIASQLLKETQQLISPDGLEGTLPYMSPEQTGRMNRGIDYRTDLYSLGVTFYQLLTHQLPFSSNDPLELVHCHLARSPVAPCDRDPTLPKVLSEIVLKLMAKMAEDRYQSATGLQHDLEHCSQQWQQHGQIIPFALGQNDCSDRFQIPEKLYGRDHEVDTLLQAFDRVASPQSSRELMLVTGYSGVGKSSLVQEVYKPIVQRRGYFIAGKFDQLQRNIPYSAIVVALRSLMQQLLTESETHLQQWQDKLLAAVGNHGQVIIDVIPEVEQILGKQPAIAALPPTEAQHRFNRVFQSFIRVFCQTEHPLVLFLDDLQWADSATLKLIHVLLSDDQTHHLFLIGAYRDNEVNAAHPLMMLLDDLKQGATSPETPNCGIAFHQIRLAPLSLPHVTQLIADTLRSAPATVSPLAERVMQKTEGNPFFVNEFLKTLHQEKLLRFDRQTHRWQWDLNGMQAIAIADNVVDLMLGKFRKLSEPAQQLLQRAACIGNRFDLTTLSVIQSSSVEAIAQTLAPVIQEGMILPTSEPEISLTTNCLIQIQYKFLHDRVQQAAYALIDPEQQQAVHLKIGRLLLANCAQSDANDLALSANRLFEVVGHLNLGQALITDAEEQHHLAQLNLQAGQKAKSAAAYDVAQDYLSHAYDDLGDAWETDYETSFILHQELAENSYLVGDAERSHCLIRQTLAHAKTPLEQAEIYRLLIVVHTLQADYAAAIAAGRAALALLDIQLPSTELPAAFEAELAQAQSFGAGHPSQRAETKGSVANLPAIADLLNAPEMTSPEKKTAAKLLMALGAPTYFSQYDLWLIVVMQIVNLSLQYGQLPESTYGYSEYGLILGSMLGDYETGYEFGQLSLNISEKLNALAEKCQVCLVIGGSINHWVRPLKEDAITFTEGYQAGLESGELQFAGYNIAHQMVNTFYQGVDLESLAAKLPDYLQFARQTQNQLVEDMLLACDLAIRSLRVGNARELRFSTEHLTEAQYLEHSRTHGSLAAVGMYLIFKAQILLLYDQPAAALQSIQQAEALRHYFPGCISLAAFNVCHSLSLVAQLYQVSASTQALYRQQIAENQQQMQRWATLCPENFLHHVLLVEAELARRSANPWDAIALYDQAIAAAEANGFIQDAAFANELAAQFWLKQGKEKMAQAYLLEAYYGYQRWGAEAKLADLHSRYPYLANAVQESTHGDSIDQTFSISHSSSSISHAQVLDLATVIKASQAISQAIELDKLLSTLISVVLENAGAQQGIFLKQQQGEWTILSHGVNQTSNLCLLTSADSSSDQTLPLSLIHYVARTQKPLIIHNGTTEPLCANDPYILRCQPKSILCFPILYQGNLYGIFYLENNQTTQAFTRDRITVLSLLSSQIAISIENATLYQTLQSANTALQASETRERDRALDLERSLQQLKQVQLQLVQNEKMSALGNLVAGVAHEINNPIGFLNGSVKNVQEYTKDLLEHLQCYQQRYSDQDPAIQAHAEEISLKFLTEDLPKLTQSMKGATDTLKGISMSLRIFSRADTEHKVMANIHEGIDSTLLILKYRLKGNDLRSAIAVIKNYGDVPPIECFPGQLNQVFMNIVANAIDAIDEAIRAGTLSPEATQAPQVQIQTVRSLTQKAIAIHIRDTGPGMSEAVQARIFDHLFTTKGVGKGTGLGLSIARQIVEQTHGGSLQIKSTLGEGAEFIITLPM
ncbi:trifunctional serine/threonine-protein kinase/ATP-binding protein/sensor histidine kinase [Myxacorys almedinensis]|uniref:histidine kinase n=1 Tax=Myxacorys almedinensis A TaxID=2690445 RepID=A0A8J8CMP4_9CYAN|nr:ATP-binding sensor histidine kinase [Myxacorys almedinensis]NDJ17522.1 AAA family ATPase [Myxacorys almedinensis A]